MAFIRTRLVAVVFKYTIVVLGGEGRRAGELQGLGARG